MASCPIHQDISPDEVRALKEAHPNALVLAHPECNAQVCELADYLGSTAGIIDRVVTGEETDYIICRWVLRMRSPSAWVAKRTTSSFIFPATTPRCEDMSSITLEQIAEALENTTEEVEVEAEFVPAAKETLTRMLELSS